jgi:hypothetical protein
MAGDLASLAKTQALAKFWLIEVELKPGMADNWL